MDWEHVRKVLDGGGRACPECGAVLEDWFPHDLLDDEFGEIGRRCPRCGHADVTTYSPPMLEDRTVYRVWLRGSERPGLAAVRCVDRRLYGTGVVAARALLMEGDVLVDQGRALAVRAVMEEFEAKGLDFYVVPDYPWPVHRPPAVPPCDAYAGVRAARAAAESRPGRAGEDPLG
jgi:ribosomal protein S27AE